MTSHALESLQVAFNNEHLRNEEREREEKAAAAQAKKLKRAVDKAYRFCDDEAEPVAIAEAAQILVGILRRSLRVKQITEQVTEVQEARALVGELLDQVRTNATAIQERLSRKDTESKKRLATMLKVSPQVKAAEEEAAQRREEQRALCQKALSKLPDLHHLVPPRKTLHGEGWGWVPLQWLHEIGHHLFGGVEREQRLRARNSKHKQDGPTSAAAEAAAAASAAAAKAREKLEQASDQEPSPTP